MAYSLSPPRLTSKTVPGHERQREALRDLRLHKDRCALIALVGVLLVNGSMVLLGVVAALEDRAEKLAELTQSVARVVNMRLGLLDVSIEQMRWHGHQLTQSPFFSIMRAKQ